MLQESTTQTLSLTPPPEPAMLPAAVADDRAVNSDLESARPPIMVLASMRAGSTLLRVMLDRHPQIFAPPELHLLPFANLDDQRRQFRGTVLAEGLVDAIEKLLHVERSRAEEITDDFVARGWSGRRILDWLRQQCAPRYLIDKSPTNAWSPAGLARAERLDPKPHYIYLTRHPMAVMESIVRNGFDRMLRQLTVNSRRLTRRGDRNSDFMFFRNAAGKNPWAIAEEAWTDANHNIVDMLRNVPAERQTIVSFEELVADPAAPLQRICRDIGLAFDTRMLSPYQRRQRPGRSRRIGVGDPNFLQHSSIRADFANRWQERCGDMPSLGEDSRRLATHLGYDDPILRAAS